MAEMNKVLDLYLTFLKIGAVNFGGGYAMLPLLQRELCEKRNWLPEEELTHLKLLRQSQRENSVYFTA